MKKVFMLVIVAALALVGQAEAANSLAVTNAAAQDGNYGLEVFLDGSTNQVYVRDDTPDQESVYRTSFWFHKNDLYMDSCSGACSTRFVNFLARQESPSAATVFRLIVRRLAADGAQGPRYSLAFGVRNDIGDFVYMGGVVLTGGNLRKHITLEWQAGDPFTNNGIARLYSSNDGGTPNLQFERTNLQNGTMRIDHIRWGATSGLDDQPTDPNTTGSIYLDSFESYRTMLP